MWIDTCITVKILKIRTSEKNCCNYPKVGTVSFYYRAKGPKDSDRMANSVDPDQTAPSSLIWVYTVCPDLSVRKLRIIMVNRVTACILRINYKTRVVLSKRNAVNVQSF